MKVGGSVPYLQQSATGPYLNGDNLLPSPIYSRPIFASHPALNFPCGHIHSGFPTNRLYTFFISPQVISFSSIYMLPLLSHFFIGLSSDRFPRGVLPAVT
jgi:hypothetical protein